MSTKPSFHIVCALLLAAAAHAAQPACETASFRVMAYNVGGGAHIPSGPEQIEQIADEIVDNAIDIAGITEIDMGAGLHKGRDMVSEIGVALSRRGYFMHHYYEPAFQHTGGWAVHAIFSRWPIRECGYRAVAGGKANTGRWVIGHIGVDVAPRTRVHFFMTHFWPWVAGCGPAIDELFAYPNEFEGPKLVMGDFNMLETSDYWQHVKDAGFINSSTAVHGHHTPTVGGSAGIAAPLPLSAQIDYVVGSSDVTFTDGYVHYTSLSDHWPIIAEANVAVGGGPSEPVGDESPRPRDLRFDEERLKRNHAMGLYRDKKYAEAAEAMLDLERAASDTELKSFYAFSAAAMRLVDSDPRSAVAGFRRVCDEYPPSKWTAWGRHRAAFTLKDLKKYEQAEEQFISYMRDYMSVVHPTVTTVAAKLAFQQIVSCRAARGVKTTMSELLAEFARPDSDEVLSRAANYLLSVIAWRNSDYESAAGHHHSAALTDDRVEDGYLVAIAKGYLTLGKPDVAHSYVETYLAQLSPAVSRVKRAEWEIYAHPDQFEIDVHPAEAAADGTIADWSAVPTIALKGAPHLHELVPDAGADLDAKLQLAWTPTHLHVRLDVSDSRHRSSPDPDRIWRGDSVQLAIDPGLEGGSVYDSNDIEIAAALMESGVVPRVFAGSVSDFRANVTRPDDDHTIYELAIPFDKLGLVGKKGTQLAFNILANDSDGVDRVAWVDLTPGIGEVKAPSLYNKLTLTD